MKKLSEYSVNYPVTILMMVLAILLLGYISFDKLGMDIFPDLNNPRIFIELQAGELPPEEMESKFVQDIESVAIRQKKVVQVSSVSRVGSAKITVEYNWDADMDEAFLDLQKSITNFSQNSELDEISLSQHDPNSAPILLIGLSHPEITDMDELRKVAEGYLQNGLIRLEGIAAVEIIGGEEKEVVIETNEYLMKAYGLDISTLANKIGSTNLNETGGSIEELGRKYIIKGIGEFKSLDDISNTIVARKSNQNTIGEHLEKIVPVFLKDVAKISFENKEPENIVRINQTRSIALAIYKETKFNTVKAVELVQESMTDFKNALPGYEFKIVRNQAEFIETAISEVEESALIGILLAVLILYIFLRRIGTTLIISIAIPISVVATFSLMYFNDLTVNIMTLGGLALGAGMLVDNAIVVMENIFRNLEQGLPIKEAAIQGTAQVGGAITASTLTTIVVFLPIVYLHGAAGELFKEQAWTVAFSLVSSLFVAILVIPMLSHKFLKLKIDQKKTESIHFIWYKDFLSNILDRKNTIIFGAIALVVITILLLPTIGSEFVPRADTNSFSVNVKLQEGSTLEFTNRVTSKLESIVDTIVGEDLESIYTQIGPARGLSDQTNNLFADENTASIDINLNPERQRSTDRIIESLAKIFDEMPDLEIQFSKEESSLQSILGTNQEQIVVEIKGEELGPIKELTEKVKTRLDSVPQLINVESSFKEGRPEVNIYVDRTLSGVNNLGISSIAEQLQNQIEGENAGYWDSEGELRDIIIKYPETNLADINKLKVNNGMRDIRIDEIASLQTSASHKEILRTNQTRVGKISAQKADNTALDKVVNLIESELQQIQFPEGYQYEITGEEQKRAQSFSSLQFALLLSIILIYMVLASQFESLVHPFTILLTIPLAAVGAVLIFFVLGKSLNVMAYIGIIMLVGIAVNDSIILVDTINKLISSGMQIRDAILEAGQRRIRPIVMTSITTILALLPLTIGFGESAALRSPMALAVIGGLITSTILTLVVIPCVYFIFENLRNTRTDRV
jgi:hydrophobic/amphiphilic exporter-1 (mainly G- bacteria), HAE1 family